MANRDTPETDNNPSRQEVVARMERLHRDMARDGLTIRDMEMMVRRELLRRRLRRLAEEHGW
ncbi:MAG: hypothetical protein M3P49_01645 [Actinomycetota bacterium]|nr:hypothetical protein [Actinomycetota bacterium]